MASQQAPADGEGPQKVLCAISKHPHLAVRSWLYSPQTNIVMYFIFYQLFQWLNVGQVASVSLFVGFKTLWAPFLCMAARWQRGSYQSHFLLNIAITGLPPQICFTNPPSVVNANLPEPCKRVKLIGFLHVWALDMSEHLTADVCEWALSPQLDPPLPPWGWYTLECS